MSIIWVVILSCSSHLQDNMTTSSISSSHVITHTYFCKKQNILDNNQNVSRSNFLCSYFPLYLWRTFGLFQLALNNIDSHGDLVVKLNFSNVLTK